MEACVRCTKYRPSPIPSGGLEIPIVLVIKKEDSTEGTFEKTEDLLLLTTKSYYIEPDKIVAKNQQIDDTDFEVEYVPETALSQEEVIMETQETQVVPETQDIGNTQIIPETQNIIIIDDD